MRRPNDRSRSRRLLPLQIRARRHAVRSPRLKTQRGARVREPQPRRSVSPAATLEKAAFGPSYVYATTRAIRGDDATSFIFPRRRLRTDDCNEGAAKLAPSRSTQLERCSVRHLGNVVFGRRWCIRRGDARSVAHVRRRRPLAARPAGHFRALTPAKPPTIEKSPISWRDSMRARSAITISLLLFGSLRAEADPVEDPPRSEGFPRWPGLAVGGVGCRCRMGSVRDEATLPLTRNASAGRIASGFLPRRAPQRRLRQNSSKSNLTTAGHRFDRLVRGGVRYSRPHRAL